MLVLASYVETGLWALCGAHHGLDVCQLSFELAKSFLCGKMGFDGTSLRRIRTKRWFSFASVNSGWPATYRGTSFATNPHRFWVSDCSVLITWRSSERSSPGPRNRTTWRHRAKFTGGQWISSNPGKMLDIHRRIRLWSDNSAKYSLGEMFQADGTDLRELNWTRHVPEDIHYCSLCRFASLEWIKVERMGNEMWIILPRAGWYSRRRGWSFWIWCFNNNVEKFVPRTTSSCYYCTYYNLVKSQIELLSVRSSKFVYLCNKVSHYSGHNNEYFCRLEGTLLLGEGGGGGESLMGIIQSVRVINGILEWWERGEGVKPFKSLKVRRGSCF